MKRTLIVGMCLILLSGCSGNNDPIDCEVPNTEIIDFVEVEDAVEQSIEETTDIPQVPNVIESHEPIEVETEPETVVETKTHLGTFKAYAYCDCAKCCGKWSGSPTASGTNPTQGRTIAVDPDIIPLGTKVYIEGYGYYVAEDTGTGINGNTIDVFHNSHSDALEWGIKYVEIYKIG